MHVCIMYNVQCIMLDEFKYLSYIIYNIYSLQMPQLQKLLQTIQDIYLRVNQNFKIIIDSDPYIQRQDSARGLLSLMTDIKTILAEVNKMSVQERAKNFNLTYNAVVYISDIASMLRKSNYSFETIKELVDCILAMEANIILQDAKYLDKRTKIYLDICHIYEENQYLQAAAALLDTAITKYKQLKAIHEMDPPIPYHIQTIINNNLRILKIMQIKYLIQSGALGPNDWRKKVDEEFGDDVPLKLLSLTECLRTQTRKQSNIFQKSPHTTLAKNFKEVLVQAGYDLVKPIADVLLKSLNEQKSKIQREVAFKTTQLLTQQLINEEIKKKREIEQKYTKYNDFKKACANFPFEYHTELIHYAYEVKNNKILPTLLELALLRVECRRIEVPYINDVGIIASSTPNPNIPNGYEKIGIDLNEANLRIQLKKLRKKNQGKGIQQQKPAESKDPKDAKDAKKGGKDAKDKAPPQQPKKAQNKDTPTEWQLQQINHKFVYMIIKRTMSPENAVYELNIVMGDEEEGPVGYMDTRRIIVPYIQEDMNIQESKVKQYKGIKESTNMVPYIILKHSKNSLENQQQKRNVIIDVKPLIGKNPIIPPQWGYKKIPIDLRQVPQQFLKSSTHDYVYISYKTDELFYSCQRHVKILNALNQLQNTQSSGKVENTSDEKLLELGITFSLQKLDNLFLVLQECLEGKLGQDYYILRSDFLTHLAFYIWVKYLRGPLVQFDYVNEMRLNEELVDYDYQFYKDALYKCKPVFLNGFKVLNFIMVNNPKSDILLLSRINLQLLKLLQEQREYKFAIENAKMCLDRIRIYRDQYLTRGLKGNQNKLLPFSLTCSNVKIKETLSKMQGKFKEQRNYIRKLKRIQQRKVNQIELNQQELQEEQNEFLHYQKKDEIDQIIEKVPADHLQLISILSAVELDIFNMLFRVTLKHAEHLKIVERQSSNGIINGIKESTMQGLATSMKNKLSMMASKNQQKNRNNLKQLQSTLIQAEKLPPPKPGLHWLEKKTIQQYSKNSYAMALLMGNFAAINSQSEDKKYFLQQSLQHIKRCIEQETQYCTTAIKNAIFIYSTLWDDEVHPESSSSSISPFKQLYDGTWPCAGQTPEEPILISKNSSTISMKMPPFKNAAEGKRKKKIKYMTLYGKPSANGVDVSINCNQLQGTGLKNNVDQVVKVTHLKPNNVYCFAVAPTNQQSQLEQIGKTSPDIPTCNPLPIAMLASYIAKISYQINQYQIAYNAAKIVVDQVCELTSYQTPDERANNLYAYKFKENALKSVSLLEIRSLTESLYIMALCERRKFLELKEKSQGIVPIVFQQKQQKITNWLMLASLLNPCLTAPIISIPFLIPQQFTVFKALSLSLIPSKWMNSKLRQLRVKVMQKVLKWGLQSNQIGFARRIVYKWAERKWLMLGKIIQIEEKKDVKKGAKDTKAQQPKLIDKYCRMLIQKSPGQMQLFEDALSTISEEYSDFTNQSIERAKQQIAYYTQFVDNPSEQLDGWINKLNSRLELVQYLKDPVNNIKKIPQNSPYYLEYNCKILRKALQNSVLIQTDTKVLLTKSLQLNIPTNNKDIALNKEIQALMLQAIANDIEWIPTAKNDLIKLQEKTGKDLSKSIQIYTNYEIKMEELTKNVAKMDSLVDKYTDFDYLNLWISELYYLKATISILNSPQFQVKNPVKGRFDKVRLINLQDLLKKKREIEILQKQSTTYNPQQLKSLNQILRLLCDAAYSSYSIQNFIKLQNIFKLLYNLLNKYLITPFYHKDNNIWQYFTFISLMGILMLKKIREKGFDIFKKRYNTKQARTQLKIIANKLSQELEPEQMVQIFEPVYYLPELDRNTTKNYWFESFTQIDMQSVSSIIAYTVQTLRLENKYNLVINLSREFCNVTQHYYSLQLLPFMIESQQKLIDEVKEEINKEKKNLDILVEQYMKKKQSKMKGERQHKLTNQPLPYQIEFEENKKKVNESMQLLEQHQKYLSQQISVSQVIIQEIKRDTSKTVLKLREQRKYMMEFGDDEEHMFKNYGDDTRLAKNRKNAVKDIIEQYDKIYKELKNSKTSKDPLAEIQNRNQVGNLQFAAGSYEKAEQFWEDALATIFKTVRPVDNYLQIFKSKPTFLVNSIGEKETLLSLNLLYKIAKYGSFKKLYYQYNCTKFASRLATALFESDSRHPQNLLGHASYRLTKLSEKDCLEDQATINLSELINSLQFFALRLIDMGNSIQALPMINLHEHIVIDIVKNVEYSVKVKLIKAIALANCGLISQSIVYLAKVANEKDLPNIWIEPSDQMKRQKGSNWYLEEISFDNSKPWNDNTNKQAIEYLKKLSIKNDFVNTYGLISVPLFNYVRALIISKIFFQEIYDNFENNQLRIANINEAESIMRDSVKKLAILDQHYSNLQDIESAKLKLNKNQLNDEAEKGVQTAKNAMITYLKNNGIEEALIPRYQAQKSTALKRVFRVQLMVRIRFSIHETYISKRMISNSFHVLKNGLANLHQISYGSRKVETGYDPEISSVPPVQAPTGKKDDKKGGKKQQQKIQIKQQVNWQKEKQVQLKAQQNTTRISINVFWHIKLTYEIGKLMYQQNRFKTCKAIFQQLISQCKQYVQHYYSIFAQGYILRCLLRLGNFELNTFLELINLSKQKQYQRQQYLDLVMDIGEIIKGEKSIQLYESGKKVATKLWEELGMKSRLQGLDIENPQRLYTNKQEFTQDQQEQIKRKNKKMEKKGGKDDKKAAKKQDPKKKKQQSKAEYKVQPLYKYEWWNLLDEEKRQFENYTFKSHPNFYANNIYTLIPLQYIRCYIRHLQATIEHQFNIELLNQCAYIRKLIKIVESYPLNGYYYLLHLYFCLAEINKNTFIKKLTELIQRNKGKKIKSPYDDLPLNNDLINVPEYSQFVFDNRSYLQEAETNYKKFISLLKGNCLLIDNGFKIEQALWKAADNEFYLAQYCGRLKPKFYPLQKTADAENESKLIYMNQIGQAINQIQLSIKVVSSSNELGCNYSQLSSKPLEPTAKLDQDIVTQISQIDKQFKSNYPKMIADSLKPKSALTSLELITYLSKIYRQSQFMTYSNSHLQNVMLRCHRMLLSGHQGYKEKCIINNVQYIGKKSLEEKFMESGAIYMKSRLNGLDEQFIYVLAGLQKEDRPYYGRVNVESVALSKICQKLYNIRSKMSISQKKSQAVRNRDIIFYQKELKEVLIQIGQKFYPPLTQLPENIKINLTQQNISAMIKMLQERGLNAVYKQINTYLRYLHELKYKLKIQQKPVAE